MQTFEQTASCDRSKPAALLTASPVLHRCSDSIWQDPSNDQAAASCRSSSRQPGPSVGPSGLLSSRRAGSRSPPSQHRSPRPPAVRVTSCCRFCAPLSTCWPCRGVWPWARCNRYLRCSRRCEPAGAGKQGCCEAAAGASSVGRLLKAAPPCSLNIWLLGQHSTAVHPARQVT